VQNSFEDALQYTKDNIVGTHNLLEVSRKYGKLKKFIHVSTDEVYGESMIEKCENKKTEESILCPTNPYAATKASAELIAQSYYHSFNIPIIITRGNNVYGPNQYPEKIIPRFIKLLKENKKVTIQGDGSNVRGFIHVKDVVNAFDIILEKGIVGEIYNIGSDDYEEYSVYHVAKMLIQKIKKIDDEYGDDEGKCNYDDYIEYIEDRPFNDKRYYISNEKIKKLGWNIEENFDKGIDELIELE
jgi:UDP-glucose 4,6-dehydratase